MRSLVPKTLATALVSFMILATSASAHVLPPQLAHASSPPPLAQTCPTNQSQMGCNTPPPASSFGASKSTAPNGLLFPDVSVWQGAVGWPSVAAWQRQHGWAASAVFKMGEYTLDTQALRNANETARLGFQRGGYWFVRNTGCAHEAALIVWAAKYLRVQVVELDSEVPEARGYTACLAPLVRKGTGLPVDEYTSPGSNPDTVNPGIDVWTAAYGPAATPCVWTCSVNVAGKQSIRAWQFTDGRFGPVVNIPGIGSDDVSVNYGLFRAVPKPHPAPVNSGTANFSGSLDLRTGQWKIHGTPGTASFADAKHWSAQAQVIRGRWRIAGMPFGSPPQR